MSAITTHRTATAAEVRTGDVLLRGEVTGLRSRPLKGVGGGVEITYADGTVEHIAYTATVMVLAWGPNTLSWS